MEEKWKRMKIGKEIIWKNHERLDKERKEVQWEKGERRKNKNKTKTG